jgi:hypothetical protein
MIAGDWVSMDWVFALDWWSEVDLLGGLDLGVISWVGVLESVVGHGSIDNGGVLAVVVTGEIIR